MYSRHDFEFMASAVVLVVLAVAARVAGLVPFRAYPALHMPVSVGELGLALALLTCALLPFANRRGIEQ